MESRVKLQLAAGEAVDLVLKGSPAALEGLIQRLRTMGGALEVRGGQCCWTLSKEGSTLHLVLDSDKVA